MPCETEVYRLRSLMDRLVSATEASCREEEDGQECLDTLEVLRMYKMKLQQAMAEGAGEALLRACNGMTTINKGLSDKVWTSRHPTVQTLAGEVMDAAIDAGRCLDGSKPRR